MIVVTGASGNVGRPLVASLARAGHTVTAVARGQSVPLAPHPGVMPVAGDLTNPRSLAPALAGAEAFFLLLPGAGVGIDCQPLVDLATAAGIRRIVLLSSQGVGTRPGLASHALMAAAEEAVRRSRLDWTILRPGGFMSNDLAWAPAIQAGQQVLAPFGDVGLPVIDSADIAEVAALALTSAGHDGNTYVLTGPETASPRRRAEILGDVLGQPLTFTELSPAQAREEMLRFMPAPVADGTLAILGSPTREEAQVSPDVEKVLGRPGSSFSRWARRNAGLFRSRQG